MVAHQVGVLDGAAILASGGECKVPRMPEDRSDPAALWDRSRDGVLESLDQQGALQREGTRLALRRAGVAGALH